MFYKKNSLRGIREIPPFFMKSKFHIFLSFNKIFNIFLKIKKFWFRQSVPRDWPVVLESNIEQLYSYPIGVHAYTDSKQHPSWFSFYLYLKLNPWKFLINDGEMTCHGTRRTIHSLAAWPKTHQCWSIHWLLDPSKTHQCWSPIALYLYQSV